MKIDLAVCGSPVVCDLLRRHPRVEQVESSKGPDIEFEVEGFRRKVEVGNPTCALAGLVDLMDNNPLVCADAASVPDPASTLSLVALAPLAAAGILVERPTVLLNFQADAQLVDAFLARHMWREGATVACEEMNLGRVLAATVIAAIRTPERLEDVDDLYDEAYGRSFFIHPDESGDWDVRKVENTPHALYRLRIAPDFPESLLTILVMSDRDGKCGAAQQVHCMNVMAGIEESLGIC